MAKATPTSISSRLGTGPASGPVLRDGVRFISPAGAFEDFLSFAPSYLAELSPTKLIRTVEALRPIALEVGIAFLNELTENPGAPIRSDPLEAWAAALVLSRWASDFIETVRPYLWDPNLRPEDRPPFPLESLVPNFFRDRVATAVERFEFRLDAVVTLPSEAKRSAWIQSVIEYAGWDWTGGRIVPRYPFVPRFIDAKGRDWTVPALPTEPLDSAYSDFGRRVFGWLSEMRSTYEHPKGSRFSDAVWVRARELKRAGRTSAQIVATLLEEGFSSGEIPSERTLRRRLSSERPPRRIGQ
jgi:hypothetical protein